VGGRGNCRGLCRPRQRSRPLGTSLCAVVRQQASGWGILSVSQSRVCLSIHSCLCLDLSTPRSTATGAELRFKVCLFCAAAHPTSIYIDLPMSRRRKYDMPDNRVKGYELAPSRRRIRLVPCKGSHPDGLAHLWGGVATGCTLCTSVWSPCPFPTVPTWRRWRGTTRPSGRLVRLADEGRN
jgi:hypothetical protein